MLPDNIKIDESYCSINYSKMLSTIYKNMKLIKQHNNNFYIEIAFKCTESMEYFDDILLRRYGDGPFAIKVENVNLLQKRYFISFNTEYKEEPMKFSFSF